MNKSDVGVFCTARTSSTRCKKKMIRPFANTTLTDILLSKLAKIGDNVFFSGYEPLFKEKCDFHGVPFVQRTEKSALSEGPLLEVFDFLAEQPYEYFLFFNGCLPFLKTETISNFLDICIEDDKPKFAVLKRNNYFTDVNGNPYNFSKDLKIMDTKAVEPVHEFAHALYFYKKSYFLEYGRYWNWSDVRYVEIEDGIEAFDIDTEEQFQMAEAMWRGLSIEE